jgi:uncharacterized protein with von Willebrand factor type A (vWA) domain
MTAPAQPLDLLWEFIRLLRVAGLRVGLTETQDALRALLFLHGQFRSARTALKATLIKRRADEEIFDRVFDLFFSFAPEARGLQLHSESRGHIQETAIFPTDTYGREGRGDLPGSSHGAHRAALSYHHALERAVQLVLRYAYHRSDPHVAQRTQEAIALMSHMVKGRTETQKNLNEVRKDLEHAFLQAVGNLDALEALLTQGDFENLDFARLDETEAELVEREIERLITELASRPKRRYHREKHGRLDLRRTIRKSIQYGGVPIKVARKKRRVVEPKIFILADISNSVETFARFFLMLTRAFHVTVGACRSFVFVDCVSEITERLDAEMARSAQAGQAVEKALARLRLEGWGLSHSDYGTVFRQFYSEWGNEVDRHTMIVILGDARTNYAAPQMQWLQRLHGQAEKIIWLNPERRSLWDSGDSVMSTYRPYCARTLECRNLEQLRKVVRELAKL